MPKRSDPTYLAADMVAAEFCAMEYRNPERRVTERTIARNTILQCLGVAEEPDFLETVAAHRVHAADARAVIRRMTPHLLNMVGATQHLSDGAT